MNKIDVEQLPYAQDLPLPKYATVSSVGLDLYAAVSSVINLRKGDRVLVPTGIKIALDPNFEAQIRSRSGLAFKYGLTVLNSPGTIDPDYRDEIKVLLVNLGNEDYIVKRGMRIAQMVIAPISRVVLNKVKELDKQNDRGGGYGSTGLF